ncbi:hypothetical protein SUBVAR_06409 [Subdoligranulum variabile DSM 15176]|uniref:Uncharacterized protein n=1 Tax=Subdoligranulum variabile DSM 15176 TaxID=411471 RepID=D1PPU2_9FIRM|nr:hypothetical protein SUBVAR_06409 [Subdoligranulum variabile DSM 15176]
MPHARIFFALSCFCVHPLKFTKKSGRISSLLFLHDGTMKTVYFVFILLKTTISCGFRA